MHRRPTDRRRTTGCHVRVNGPAGWPPGSYGDRVHGVDRDEAERRERRRDLLAAPLLVGFFAGIVLLTGRFGFWTGGAAWAAVGGLGLSGLALSAAQLSRRQRARATAAHQIQAALRAHADPGPELRVRADTQARYTARSAWVALVGWVVPLGFLLDGQWDTRPVAATVGAVLVVGAAAAHASWWRGRVADARRWLADPPGPPREPAPPTRAERWLAGRRVALVAGSVFALALAVGLVVGLTRG